MAAADYKYLVVLWIGRGNFFTDFGNSGKTRAALEQGTHFAKLLRGSHYKHLNTTIAEVFYVAPNFYFGCGALRKVTVPNTLDGAGDQILSGLF